MLDIYSKQAIEGKTQRPGKGGFKGLGGSLSSRAADHSVLQ